MFYLLVINPVAKNVLDAIQLGRVVVLRFDEFYDNKMDLFQCLALIIRFIMRPHPEKSKYRAVPDIGDYNPGHSQREMHRER